MVSRTNKFPFPAVNAVLVLLLFFSSSLSASFDEATKAYLLGDYEKARYEALVDATDGNPAAQMLLGQLYFNGEGVEKDIDHALYWYNRSADGGFRDAQYRLGILYHDGAPGIQKNLDLAYIYLSQAREGGHKDAGAKLEWLYKTDQGIVVNLNDDVEVLKKVAANGNQKARFLLSQKMLKGAGVPQDMQTAVTMLKEDAQVGFIKAQKQLGEIYYYGSGVEKDFIEAYAWSMAYAGTRELGGIAREGKQVARSALRKLPQEVHNEAYVKSKEYFEKYVLPFHKNAREVGPDKYRIVVRSRIKKETQVAQKSKQTQASTQTAGSKQPANDQSGTAGGSKPVKTPTVPVSVGPGVSDKTASQVKQANELKQEVSKTEVTETSNKPGVAAEDTKLLSTADSVMTVEKQKGDAALEKAEKNLTEKDNTIAGVESQNSDIQAQENDQKTEMSVVENSLPKKADVGSADNLGPVASREDKEIIRAEPLSATSVETEKEAVLPERKFEDVYNVLVRKKSALNQLYYKEYELNKQLEGRVVFELVIAADGKISSVEVVSNTVDSPTLEDSLVDYLKSNISFESAKVADFRITYPVDFLPP